MIENRISYWPINKTCILNLKIAKNPPHVVLHCTFTMY